MTPLCSRGLHPSSARDVKSDHFRDIIDLVTLVMEFPASKPPTEEQPSSITLVCAVTKA